MPLAHRSGLMVMAATHSTPEFLPDRLVGANLSGSAVHIHEGNFPKSLAVLVGELLAVRSVSDMRHKHGVVIADHIGPTRLR
jgi:hypothetical protein